MARSVQRLTLGLGSGHELTVREFEPRIGHRAADGESAWDSLSLSLSAPPLLFSHFPFMLDPLSWNLEQNSRILGAGI